MSPAQVVQFEQMYDPASEHQLRERGADSDVLMFGFYIRNNIGVGFRTFAGGIFVGLGTLFFLIYNGLLFGAVSGHISNIGYEETFRSFVAGHGPFELTAIVLAGASGFMIGMAVLAPGPAPHSTTVSPGSGSSEQPHARSNFSRTAGSVTDW